ncbi:hypothetical protein BCR34DRAFT_600258 [Clohesyomyces aquaticus]|uniref:Uncharacterized protein n=1 Tax=Clohesyomyces aquaticus TaxID=1231657 RepID=A0A1Y1ZRT6_9PLEO|nr:hypothetical protein BCR34DRAFT_600258 [Clohesyomyces aquaticus]
MSAPFLHPDNILDFLISGRLPTIAAKSSTVNDYYAPILDHPFQAMEQCRSLLEDWVVEIFEQGHLLDTEILRQYRVAPEEIDSCPGIYICVHLIGQEQMRYGGRSCDLSCRISKEHDNPRYRGKNPSLNYLCQSYAQESFFVLPVKDLTGTLEKGPLMNLLEQWVCVIFRTLQSHEMSLSLPAEAFAMLSSVDLDSGANLREPLAQWISWGEYPERKHFGLSQSPHYIKQEWGRFVRNKEKEDNIRRKLYKEGYPYVPPPYIPRRPVPWNFTMINGEIHYPADENWPPSHPPLPPYTGSLSRWNWGSNYSDYQFMVQFVHLRVSTSYIDRLEDDSI